MKKINLNINILLNIIALAGLILTGVFIQISNNAINSYNADLVFDMATALQEGHLAIVELLTLIGSDTRELIGYPQHLDINELRSEASENYLRYVADIEERGTNIRYQLDHPPVCFLSLNCTTFILILYYLQIFIIILLILLNIRGKRLFKKSLIENKE